MSVNGKNKLLTWLVILLVVANAATIAMFWLRKDKKLPPLKDGRPREFMIRELKLDSVQQIQLEALVKEHRDSAEVLRKKIREAKESLFGLLKEANVSDSAKQSAAKAVSVQTETLDLLTFNHFQKIRAICNPEQQKKFDEIIHDVTRMIGQPQPPGRPGGPPGGPPPGERPPPPL